MNGKIWWMRISLGKRAINDCCCSCGCARGGRNEVEEDCGTDDAESKDEVDFWGVFVVFEEFVTFVVFEAFDVFDVFEEFEEKFEPILFLLSTE